MSEVDDWGEITEDSGAFDENSLGGINVAKNAGVRVATAGMGGSFRPDGTFDFGSGTADSPSVWSQSQYQDFLGSGSAGGKAAPAGGTGTGLSTEARAGIATSVIGGLVDAVGRGFGIAQEYQSAEAERTATSQLLQRQLSALDEQIASARDARERQALEAQRDAASGALNSGDLAAMLAALQATQQSTVPTWAWVVGGVLLVGIGGTVIYLLARKD